LLFTALQPEQLVSIAAEPGAMENDRFVDFAVTGPAPHPASTTASPKKRQANPAAPPTER
jgi:hypothetical protein